MLQEAGWPRQRPQSRLEHFESERGLAGEKAPVGGEA